MLKKYQSYWGLVLLLLSINASAATDSDACKVTTPLKSNQWQQIGLPCNAPKDANTVEAIFADDISGSYGTDWMLIGYNTSSNSYEDIGLQDVPQVGTGYWIISLSDQTTLDMPDGSQPVNQSDSTQCTSSACFEKALASNDTGQSQLIANPYSHSFAWTAVRGKVTTDDNACGDSKGCSLAEMQTEGFVENQGWRYNGTEYKPLKGSEISPWMGLWVATLDTASSTPTLLFPGIKPTNHSKPKPKPKQGENVFNLGFNDSPLGEYTSEDVERDWPGTAWSKTDGRVTVYEEENGNRFIRVKYPKGGVGPAKGGAQWKMNFDEAFGKNFDELYISYKVRFRSGFNPVLGGKLPGMVGGTANGGGRRANGRDGWSARMMWREDNAAIFYIYHADMKGNFGDKEYWGGEENPNLFTTNEWVQVEHRIVMNSPGEKNGILQGWYNGELVHDNHNMRYRKVDSFAIDAFYFSTFFGGSNSKWAPTRNETIDFDSFVFSTKPISH